MEDACAPREAAADRGPYGPFQKSGRSHSLISTMWTVASNPFDSPNPAEAATGCAMNRSRSDRPARGVQV
jgi:hypothetical protein